MIILASASPVRAKLVGDAGITAAIEPSGVDETTIKVEFRRRGRSPLDCAMALAEAKARAVSRRHAGALVIGADQILLCGETWFDKVETTEAARAQLLALRGRTHVLETAVCAVRDEETLWHAASRPHLTMRCFSDVFLAAYLAAEGAAIRGSLGGYRLEGRGVQLFSRIDGDYFAILGLPLIELLEFLRKSGALPA